MRNLAVFFVVSVASAGLCASVGVCADPSKEAALNGRWTSDTAVKAGEAYPDNVRKSISLVMMNGHFRATVGGDVDEGTFKIDDSENPKTITFVATKGPSHGKTIQGIYELNKGSLRLCSDLSGKTRPTKFESKPGTESFLASYQLRARKLRLRPQGEGNTGQ